MFLAFFLGKPEGRKIETATIALIIIRIKASKNIKLPKFL